MTSAATITTAARADCGRSLSSELKNTSKITTTPAPMRPVSCVFAPDCSATAVRDPLVETAKPWRKPAVTFAAPMPIISWFGSTSSPRLAAKLEAVAMVSVSETSVMPTAATKSGPTSLSDVHGISGDGNPFGREPTVTTPFDARSSTADTIVAPATATRTAGTRRVSRGSTSSTASTARPTRSARPTVWSRLLKKAPTSSKKPSASVEKPKSLGS